MRSDGFYETCHEMGGPYRRHGNESPVPVAAPPSLDNERTDSRHGNGHGPSHRHGNEIGPISSAHGHNDVSDSSLYDKVCLWVGWGRGLVYWAETVNIDEVWRTMEDDRKEANLCLPSN